MVTTNVIWSLITAISAAIECIVYMYIIDKFSESKVNNRIIMALVGSVDRFV